MKKIIKLFIIVIGVFLITGCNSSRNLENISFKEYKNLIEKKEDFALEIMRTDCSACVAFKPKLEKFLKEYNLKIKVINTDDLTKEEYQELMDITNISGTPTILFYKNGKESSISTRIVGNVSTTKLIDKFKSAGLIK